MPPRIAGQKRRRPTPQLGRQERGGWFRRQRDDLIRDGLIGLVILGVGTGAAVWWDSRIAERQEALQRELTLTSEVQENTRFVRQVVIDDAAEKPFQGLNLSGASLGGLDLGCEDFEADPAVGCADLVNANLSGANLTDADMRGANLSGANLTDADMRGANLSGANLGGAFLPFANLSGVLLIRTDLSGAFLYDVDLTDANLIESDLTGADLARANLTDADLADVDLTDICYDEDTVWPDGFAPPPSVC